jgi:hypothetical protein
MSDYVKISGSVAEVLAAAGRMTSDAAAFTATAETITQKIRAVETSGVLGGTTGSGGDEYYRSFAQNYYKVIDEKPVNMAVTDLAAQAGQHFQTRGRQATDGVTAYLGVDGENAISIQRAAQQQAVADAIDAKNRAAAQKDA